MPYFGAVAASRFDLYRPGRIDACFTDGRFGAGHLTRRHARKRGIATLNALLPFPRSWHLAEHRRHAHATSSSVCDAPIALAARFAPAASVCAEFERVRHQARTRASPGIVQCKDVTPSPSTRVPPRSRERCPYALLQRGRPEHLPGISCNPRTPHSIVQSTTSSFLPPPYNPRTTHHLPRLLLGPPLFLVLLLGAPATYPPVATTLAISDPLHPDGWCTTADFICDSGRTICWTTVGIFAPCSV
ncbi:hypothetical protein B0H14DRAFT_2671297, partial [Mycena olivaceomarginata]